MAGIRPSPWAPSQHTEIYMLEVQQTVLLLTPPNGSGDSIRSRLAWTGMQSGDDGIFENGGCDAKK
jgi:hypothetical protein